MFSTRTLRACSTLFSGFILAFAGCAAPREDPLSAVGKQSIIYKVNAALTAGDCTSAIIGIEPLYNSSSSDDEVRRLRASAHACKAGINFFPLIGNLATGSFSGNGLWRTITQLFPASASDGKTQASFYATDALMSWLKPGTVVSSTLRISDDPYNLGSKSYLDRTDDSNLYLALVSMATIGTLHNAYGAPNGSYAPTQALPWTTLAAMDEEGCGYASSLLNLVDSLAAVGASYTQLSGVSSAVSAVASGFDAACDQGCQNLCPSLSCNGKCPATLRHRTACNRATAATEDLDACAAAGLVSLMNSPLGWQ